MSDEQPPRTIRVVDVSALRNHAATQAMRLVDVMVDRGDDLDVPEPVLTALENAYHARARYRQAVEELRRSRQHPHEQL